MSQNILLPPPLKTGDRVWVVAPSSFCPPEKARPGIDLLKSWGLDVQIGTHVWDAWGSFSATDANRCRDLQQAIDDEDARAVFCVRGGYGSGRILEEVDLKSLATSPKWFVGFSDATLLLLALNSTGIASVHGPMVAQLAQKEYSGSAEALNRLLFGPRLSLAYPVSLNFSEWELSAIEGPLLGGNLSLLAFSAGSDRKMNTSGAVLFFEEVGEKLYRIDRMVWQLKHAGFFENARAIVLGHFTRCESDQFPLSVAEIFQQAAPHVPVFAGLQAGHDAPNFPLVFGISALLKKVSRDSWSLTQDVPPIRAFIS